MSRGFYPMLLCGLLFPPSPQAAPDPMSAGRLRSVEISVAKGDVHVTLAKTQHVRIDGRETDALRDGSRLKFQGFEGSSSRNQSGFGKTDLLT